MGFLREWWFAFVDAMLAPFLKHYEKKRLFEHKIQRDLLDTHARISEDHKELIIQSLDTVRNAHEQTASILTTWLEGFTKISQPIRLKTVTDDTMLAREQRESDEWAPSPEDLQRFVESIAQAPE